MSIAYYRQHPQKLYIYADTITVGDSKYDIYIFQSSYNRESDTNCMGYALFTETKDKRRVDTSGALGVITMTLNYKTGEAECPNLYVHEESSQRGLGTALLLWAMQQAKDTGMKTFRLLSDRAMVVPRKVDQKEWTKARRKVTEEFDRNAYIYYTHANMEIDEDALRSFADTTDFEYGTYIAIPFKKDLICPVSPCLKKWSKRLQKKVDFTDHNMRQIIKEILAGNSGNKPNNNKRHR